MVPAHGRANQEELSNFRIHGDVNIPASALTNRSDGQAFSRQIEQLLSDSK